MACLGLKGVVDVDELLKNMDTDANGEISIAEFKNNLPKNVLQAMSAKLTDAGLIEGVVDDGRKKK